MPAAKKNTNNSVIGGLKTKPKHHLFLFGAIAILVLVTAGYFGYNKYKAHSLTAHAAGMRLLISNTNGRISACATPMSSAYGNVYRINGVAVRSNLNGTRNVILNYRNGSYISAAANGNWWANIASSVTDYASINYSDSVIFQIQNNRGQTLTSSVPIYPSTLPSC